MPVGVIYYRVADPHLFHPDSDPAFEAEYRSGSNPDPGLNDQKLKKKITAEKKKFWIKNYNLLGLHKERSSY